MLVSVAIPVLDGGSLLRDVLSAVRRQVVPDGVELELVVCDSGSRDGSVEAVVRAGGEVVEIEPASFGHGTTRNLLMERSRGELVAFLTQDAVPASDRWLARLVAGFDASDRVGLAFGPYLPRPDASPMVARELTAWFARLSPDGAVRVDRLGEAERAIPPRDLYGVRAYFTDANGCVSRAAWAAVPFRPIAYAEDHALALDMLRAGWAKAYVPDAAVVHSHEYGIWDWLRRSFDEARAVADLYGLTDLGDLRRLARGVRGAVGADLRATGGLGAAGGRAARYPLLVRSLAHHGARAAGTALGARAAGLPPALAGALSLERRA